MITHKKRPLLTLRRGMALLLVMIGLVVCTVLTAGFLATQGTSIGIARNERDAAKAHAIAQTGIDMCYWLIRNKSDWRQTMPVGNWLTLSPVGDGAVSVSVDDDNHNFFDDPARPVTLSSTGSYHNRDFTLTATLRPTGGGTIFREGSFFNGDVVIGNADLVTAAVLDSYNSSLADYNPLLPGANAFVGSNTLAVGGLTVYLPSIYRGSYTAAPTANLVSVIALPGGAAGPAASSHALESRNPGAVIFPNTTALANRGAFARSSGINDLPGVGIYDSITATNATINIRFPGTYYVNNNVTVGNSAAASLSISDNVTANLVVHGNLSVTAGKISLGPNSLLRIFVTGNVTFNNAFINSTSTTCGNTSHLLLFGDTAPGAIQLLNTNAKFCGAIYAPQHDLTLQTGSPKFFGAALAKSFTLKNTAAFHFDEALRSLVISNITSGTAPAGVPDYLVTINAGPGIPR